MKNTNLEDQLKHIPQFCIQCGHEVRITRLEHKHGQYFGEWVCDSCGHQDGAGWAELTLQPGTFRHKLLHSIKEALRSIQMRSLPRLAHSSIANLFMRSKPFQALTFSQAISQAKSSILGLSAASNLLPITFGYGDSIGLTYHDRFESPTIIVEIENQPIEKYISADQQYYYEGWANDLRQLIFQWEHMLPYSPNKRRSLYQTLNMNAIAHPPSQQSVRLTGGEELDWHIKTFKHDVQLAYAWTRYDNGLIQVWSAGVTTTEIETLLSNLVRLEPNSSATKYHQAGLDRWLDYYKAKREEKIEGVSSNDDK